MYNQHAQLDVSAYCFLHVLKKSGEYSCQNKRGSDKLDLVYVAPNWRSDYPFMIHSSWCQWDYILIRSWRLGFGCQLPGNRKYWKF